VCYRRSSLRTEGSILGSFSLLCISKGEEGPSIGGQKEKRNRRCLVTRRLVRLEERLHALVGERKKERGKNVRNAKKSWPLLGQKIPSGPKRNVVSLRKENQRSDPIVIDQQERSQPPK